MTTSAQAPTSRLAGLAVGAALGGALATKACASAIALHEGGSGAAWELRREDAAHLATALVGTAAVGLVLLLCMASCVVSRTSPRHRLPVALRTLAATAIASVLLGVVSDPLGSFWTGCVAATVVAIDAVLVWRRIEVRPSGRTIASTAVAVAVVLGAIGLLAPYRVHVPSPELISWANAHQTPSTSLLPSITEVQVHVLSDERRPDEVRAACGRLQARAAAQLVEPSPPIELLDEVIDVVHAVTTVASACEEHAETITFDQLDAMLDRATSTDAARAIGRALS